MNVKILCKRLRYPKSEEDHRAVVAASRAGKPPPEVQYVVREEGDMCDLPAYALRALDAGVHYSPCDATGNDKPAVGSKRPKSKTAKE